MTHRPITANHSRDFRLTSSTGGQRSTGSFLLRGGRSLNRRRNRLVLTLIVLFVLSWSVSRLDLGFLARTRSSSASAVPSHPLVVADKHGRHPAGSSVGKTTLPLAADDDEEEQVHPIIGLMQAAEERWLRRLERQSKTLEQAVTEYRRRYDRAPPAGFDDWFRWARANDVVFVDEYDRLEISIAAFGGLTPSAIRDSVAQFEKEHPDVDGSTRIFQIRFEGGRCQGRGMDAWDKSISPHRSGQEFCEGIKEVEHLIPDVPDFLYTSFDWGHVTVSHREQERLRAAAASNRGQPAEDVAGDHTLSSQPDDNVGSELLLSAHSKETGYLAIALSCPPGSPARQFHKDSITGKLVWDDSSDGHSLPKRLGNLIRNASLAQDACHNAELRQVSAIFLQWSEANQIIDSHGVPKSTMMPYFSQSKLPSQVDWLIPQLYNYPTRHGALSPAFAPPPWEQKQSRLVWRGRSTGVFYAGSHTIGGDWQEAQRLRLHRQCNNDVGWESYIYASSPETGSKLRFGSALRRDLLEWYDCGLVGHHDCGYDRCEAIKNTFESPGSPYRWVPKESHYERFKFIADTDGFGWSGRFRDVLSTGSVVFKATAFPEFFSDMIEPWFHYVPFNLDASDLPSLMAFFAGAPSTGHSAHDDLARAIGERGREFVERYWRREDIQAWIWRVLLEYRRIHAEEQGSMDYQPRGPMAAAS